MSVEAAVPPLVSIVVPAYRHEHLVERCLRSVAEQAYAPLELIVVDDASPDGTAQAIERTVARPDFAQLFARVVFERQERNQGAHAAINRAMALARGRFIGIVNTDDAYAPDRVRRLVDALERENAALAFTMVRFIDADDRDVTDENWDAMRMSHTQRRIGSFPSVGFALLRENVAISTGNLFFRRSLFERIGGFRALRYCHDWDFLLRALLVSEPLFLPEPLYHYRVHGSNSYKSLRDVADDESAMVLRTYFAAVQAQKYENRLAPGPATWPGLFEVFVSGGASRHWELAQRTARLDAR